MAAGTASECPGSSSGDFLGPKKSKIASPSWLAVHYICREREKRERKKEREKKKERERL